jgi:hypothetical protein
MNTRSSGFSACDDATRVERWIEQRTNGRVRMLQVEILGNRLIVHGSAGSHYVRQLAHTAALEAMEASDGRSDELELDVQVGTL